MYCWPWHDQIYGIFSLSQRQQHHPCPLTFDLYCVVCDTHSCRHFLLLPHQHSHLSGLFPVWKNVLTGLGSQCWRTNQGLLAVFSQTDSEIFNIITLILHMHLTSFDRWKPWVSWSQWMSSLSWEPSRTPGVRPRRRCWPRRPWWLVWGRAATQRLCQTCTPL